MPAASPHLVDLVARLATRRRDRQRHALFTIERHGAVIRAVHADWPVAGVVVCPSLLSGRKVRDAVATLKRRSPSVTVSPDRFRSLCTHTRASGVIAVLRQRWTPLPDVVESDDAWVVLSQVRSPGNVGTIVRTIEAAGARGLVVVGDHLEPHAPGVVRASMGGLLGIEVTRTRAGRLRRWATERGVQLVGTSPRGPVPWSAVDWARPSAIWLGNERHGLGEHELAACDVVASIPLGGAADSLNIGVAAGVLLFERRRVTLPLSP